MDWAGSSILGDDLPEHSSGFASLISILPTVASSFNALRNWGAFHPPRFWSAMSTPACHRMQQLLNAWTSRVHKTHRLNPVFIWTSPSQFMHYRRKFNSGLFYLLHNKPSPSFSPPNFLFITWSSAELIIYKKEFITFFSWPLYLQGIWSSHLTSWIPLFGNQRSRRTCKLLCLEAHLILSPFLCIFSFSNFTIFFSSIHWTLNSYKRSTFC